MKQVLCRFFGHKYDPMVMELKLFSDHIGIVLTCQRCKTAQVSKVPVDLYESAVELKR